MNICNYKPVPCTLVTLSICFVSGTPRTPQTHHGQIRLPCILWMRPVMPPFSSVHTMLFAISFLAVPSGKQTSSYGKWP